MIAVEYDRTPAKVLASETTLITMAQLVDGLQLLEVASSARGSHIIKPIPW